MTNFPSSTQIETKTNTKNQKTSEISINEILRKNKVF